MTEETEEEKKVNFFEDIGFYVFICPHCKDISIVQKDEVYCKIFRHGAYKKDLSPINPHTPKEECDKLANDGLIYGCGKPFRFVGEHPNFIIEICPYI